MSYDTVSHVLEGIVNLPLYVSGTIDNWKAIRVGSTNALGRKYICILNKSPYKIFLTTDNTADPAHCLEIRKGGERIFPYSDKVTLYGLSAETGGARIVVKEEIG